MQDSLITNNRGVKATYRNQICDDDKSQIM